MEQERPTDTITALRGTGHGAPALYCPHCAAQLHHHDDRTGARCHSCRLVVGARRATRERSGEVRASGFMANAAHRENADAVEEHLVLDGLTEVASEVGCRVERLRMADYDRVQRSGTPVPRVAEVLATFTTWKAARARAVEAAEDG